MAHTIGRVKLNFNQVDDHVDVTINGHKLSQTLLHHGQGPVSKDITSYLVEGKNELTLSAYNRHGWAVFIASLTDDGAAVHQWHHINAAASKNQPFLQETFYFYYRDGEVMSSRGAGFWATFEQVDDHLTIQVLDANDHLLKEYRHGLTHHGQAGGKYNLGVHMKRGLNKIRLRLYNGPAFAVLKGTLRIGESLERSDIMEMFDYADAAGLKNAIVFDETFEVEKE